MTIIGLDRQEKAKREKRLFSYPDINDEPEETQHTLISPYLFDASGLLNPSLMVSEESQSLNGMKKLASGTQPIDNGYYIFNAEERAALLEVEPGAVSFMRPYVGAREYLQGSKRWILALQEAPPNVLKELPNIRQRMTLVRDYRSRSNRKSTLAIADFPTRYNVEVLPTAPFLVIPKVSSERREYVPVGWLEPPTIPSDLVFILQEATLTDFALLTSAMHMAWLRHVGGRLESRYRYSIGLVYNTFPTPPSFISRNTNLSKLEPLAQAVLEARDVHPDATLADLYDPDLMPPNLRRAHQTLDRAVDKLYRRTSFSSERKRIEHLFMLYEKMRAPLDAEIKGRIPKQRRKRNL